MAALIPGLDNNITLAIFGAGTALFVVAMRIFYKGLKLNKNKEKTEPILLS